MPRFRWLALLAAMLVEPAVLAAAVHAGNLRASTELGARLAPPDLARQIVRRASRFRAGVEAVRAEIEAGGRADESVLAHQAAQEARRALDSLRRQRSFDEVIEQLGRAAALTALAGQPLAAPPPGSAEAAYGADFQRYAAAARPRNARVVYPRTDLEPEAILSAAAERARELGAAVVREYRRIGGASGIGRFDDRSTAFGVAALSFNHSTSEVAHVLRWVWREAGGGDRRVQIVRGDDGSVLIIGSSSVGRSSP